ncbi:IS66 family transposase [Lactobacillus helveticus]
MTESVPDAAVQTITYKRQAHQKKQADLLAAYPVRKELLFIPAQIKRLDHIQHAYKCLYCSSKNLNDKIIKAVVPKAPLNHSLGSASIIAHTLYQKYEMKVPDYRQESYWRKMGLNISRQHLNNWGLKSTEYYFTPMYDLLKTKLLTQPVLHADETYYRVLESETTKTYYWVFLSGRHDKHGITLYHHNPHRSGQVALDFLGAYAGFLHCDMWQAYQRLPEATLVGCWAHVRRKFFEAVAQNASDKSIAKQGWKYCTQMFRLEKEWEHLSSEERYQTRQEQLKPLMEDFFNWCRRQEISVLPGSKLGRAINYALKHQETFEHVLLDGRLELSNNKAERAVKSLVMGRKNWLFSQSFAGAQTSGIILSLI